MDSNSGGQQSLHLLNTGYDSEHLILMVMVGELFGRVDELNSSLLNFFCPVCERKDLPFTVSFFTLSLTLQST